MPRSNKPHSESKGDTIEKQCESAARTAIQSIAGLEKHLPASDAAIRLVDIIRIATDVLVGYLKHVTEPDKEGNHRAIVVQMSEPAVRIAEALLSYAHTNPNDFKDIHIGEWPGIISIFPERDIRKVDKNPKGKAAALYLPILKDFDNFFWWQTERLKERGVFHHIAMWAANYVDVFHYRTSYGRAMGLPSVLDFDELSTESTRFHILTSPIETPGNQLEWVSSLKYYLYLSLAPEPDRTRLRDHWRKLRELMFSSLVPSDADGKQLHQKLCGLEPLSIPINLESSRRQGMVYPQLLIDQEADPTKPWWYYWWQQMLQYDPGALFGNSEPLNEWKDPAIVKMVSANHVSGKPISGFGRCVNAVLDAFLRLKGVANGLKEIEHRKNPLPKFSASSIGVDDTSVEAERMREHLLNLQRHDA